jgi:Ubiquitin family
LGGQKSGIQANEFSQQLFTTPFSSPRAQSKITEFDEIDVEDLHQEDLDLKRFKKIDIISINEPGKVADSVEEMMNLVLRFKDSEEILPAERCAAIVETIALVRAEAQQGVTIFDFESEDNLFLTHSKNLVQSLSAVISTPYLSDIDLRDLSSRIETWRKWISCRIVRTLHQDILSGQVQDSGMLLVLNTLTGKRRMIRVQQTTTIQEIKYMFQDLEGLPPWDQYLVSRGKKLEEGRRVLDYHLHTQAYVHVLLPIWGRR